MSEITVGIDIGTSSVKAVAADADGNVVARSRMLAGFCYTQFTDKFQEINGLLYADRTPKVPLEELVQAMRSALKKPMR